MTERLKKDIIKLVMTPIINKPRVFIAMSGGVDSSVAAALLKKRGFDVVGVHMKCFNVDGCAEQDDEDARRAAEHLGIPFYVFDFEKEYKRLVVDYMVEGYEYGITPNPDVMCNKEIKFGLFFRKAMEMGADYIATGHYVRLGRTASRQQHNFLPARKFASLSPRHSSLRSEAKLAGLRDVPRDSSASPVFSLRVAKDKNKDQSYFLWTLTQEQLRHCLFPIGDYLKPEVRRLAKKFGLHNALKKDSQGICFLGQVSIMDFLKEYIPAKKGLVVSPSGEVIGSHKGAAYYTIGERHGFEIRHRPKSGNGALPHYIVEKDVKRNLLVAVEGEKNPALYQKEAVLSGVNFINSKSHITTSAYLPAGRAGGRALPVMARVRYRQPLFPALLLPANSYELGNKKQRLGKESSLLWKLVFKEPQRFIAPGQSAVFYLPAKATPARPSPSAGGASAGDRSGVMLGGGVIQ